MIKFKVGDKIKIKHVPKRDTPPKYVDKLGIVCYAADISKYPSTQQENILSRIMVYKIKLDGKNEILSFYWDEIEAASFFSSTDFELVKADFGPHAGRDLKKNLFND